MTHDDDPSEGRWWRRGERTRRHSYWYPTTNLQGVLLFALIALLGAAALIIVALHALHDHALRTGDGRLALIGVACLLLGGVQAYRLSRNG